MLEVREGEAEMTDSYIQYLRDAVLELLLLEEHYRLAGQRGMKEDARSLRREAQYQLRLRDGHGPLDDRG